MGTSPYLTRRVYEAVAFSLLPHILFLMSEGVSASTYYDLAYPDENSTSDHMSLTPLSPIGYEGTARQEDDHSKLTHKGVAYNNSYVCEPGYTRRREIPRGNNEVISQDDKRNMIIKDALTNHPGPPWFRWYEGSEHLGYQVMHGGKTIQCPYI